jgi:hypothetical protein
MFRHLIPLAAAAAMLMPAPKAQADADGRPQILIVGVAHLEAKADLHNASWGLSVFAPAMQAQIVRLTRALAGFKPTKVMIEARADNPLYVQRYGAYLRGAYRLGSNEDDQLGYRLARLCGLPTVYPIDSTGNFPFDYDAVRAAAAKSGQDALIARANAELAPLVAQSRRMERAGNLLGLLRYLNTDAALRLNAGWYMYLDLIGSPPADDQGERLTSAWYGRNLEIFANIARDLKSGDRALVFIGQGHAAMLRPMIERSPFLKDVDPERFLPKK